MKILCVAHPDDEVLWFNPAEFDQIIIVFGKRQDKPWMGEARRNAINNHPLKERIIFLNMLESGYWKNKENSNLYKDNYQQLINYFMNAKLIFENCKEIYTHNSIGEYGHSDHILVHDAVKHVFYYKRNIPIWVNYSEADICKRGDIQINITDFQIFHDIKDLYIKYKTWTWALNYLPQAKRYYRRII